LGGVVRGPKRSVIGPLGPTFSIRRGWRPAPGSCPTASPRRVRTALSDGPLLAATPLQEAISDGVNAVKRLFGN